MRAHEATVSLSCRLSFLNDVLPDLVAVVSVADLSSSWADISNKLKLQCDTHYTHVHSLTGNRQPLVHASFIMTRRHLKSSCQL